MSNILELLSKKGITSGRKLERKPLLAKSQSAISIPETVVSGSLVEALDSDQASTILSGLVLKEIGPKIQEFVSSAIEERLGPSLDLLGQVQESLELRDVLMANPDANSFAETILKVREEANRAGIELTMQEAVTIAREIAGPADNKTEENTQKVTEEQKAEIKKAVEETPENSEGSGDVTATKLPDDFNKATEQALREAFFGES